MGYEKYYELSGESTQADVRGATTWTAYPLLPDRWLKQILDAAKKRLFFTQFAYSSMVPKGTRSVIIPRRKLYKGFYDGTGVTFKDSAYAATQDIYFTTINNLDGTQLEPSVRACGVAITNHTLRTNAIDLIRYARDELTYGVGDYVDQHVATTLRDATDAVTATAGAQRIYGGDATSETTLSTGDVLTTDLIADAKKYLMSKDSYYRAVAGAETLATTYQKNPWLSTREEPFVLFIRAQQENALLKDSQFVNAAEYGSDKIVHLGEIGDYLGCRVVVTENAPSYKTTDTGPEGGTPAVAFTRAIMLKARRAIAIAWGLKPNIKVFDYPTRIQQRIVVESAWDAGTIHNDAIVFVDVSDA